MYTDSRAGVQAFALKQRWKMSRGVIFSVFVDSPTPSYRVRDEREKFRESESTVYLAPFRDPATLSPRLGRSILRFDNDLRCWIPRGLDSTSDSL